MDFYDREMGGRILTRIGSDVDTLSQLMQSGLVNALVSFLNFFGVAVLLVLMSPRLALFVLSVVPPLLVGHPAVPGEVVEGLRPPAGADRGGQRGS